jgi:hypothetical protein
LDVLFIPARHLSYFIFYPSQLYHECWCQAAPRIPDHLNALNARAPEPTGESGVSSEPA